jgi:hypothetical protein
MHLQEHIGEADMGRGLAQQQVSAALAELLHSRWGSCTSRSRCCVRSELAVLAPNEASGGHAGLRGVLEAAGTGQRGQQGVLGTGARRRLQWGRQLQARSMLPYRFWDLYGTGCKTFTAHRCAPAGTVCNQSLRAQLVCAYDFVHSREPQPPQRLVKAQQLVIIFQNLRDGVRLRHEG